jgi:hypothetical protein
MQWDATAAFKDTHIRGMNVQLVSMASPFRGSCKSRSLVAFHVLVVQPLRYLT